MRAFIITALCALLVSGQVSAQDDSVFDSAEPIVQDAEESDRNLADDLLAGTALSIGGRFLLEGEAFYTSAQDDPFSVGLNELSSTFFLDARPSSDFRAFVKGEVVYRSSSGVAFNLDELFTDFDISDTVFVRAGKQTFNWGVGIYFSPTNLVNLERIDPENPDEELSGPVSIKAQVPIGTDNATGYLILGDIEEGVAASLAARYETLLEGFEVTAGAILEDSGHWALMTTGTGTISDVTVFAEAVLEGNSDKVFAVEDSNASIGLSTRTSDSLFFSGTLGARYSTATQDDRYTLTASAQYFFNGLGYSDTDVLTANPEAVGALVGAGELSLGDLQGRGQHYGVVRVSSPDLGATELTPTLLGLANLSDGSGFLDAGLEYTGIDSGDNVTVTPSVAYRFTYGAEGAEYSPLGNSHSVTLKLNINGSF